MVDKADRARGGQRQSQQRQAGLTAIDVGQALAQEMGAQAGWQTRVQGKIYPATAKEAIQHATVITGTLLIHSVPVVALFDHDSIHFFIAKTLIDRIDLSIEG